LPERKHIKNYRMQWENSEAGASEPETRQFQCPARGQSPIPSETRHAGGTALYPGMSVAPAAVHTQLHRVLLSLADGTTIRYI
jgi:hypothetical protein